jgi:hypothetical protein
METPHRRNSICNRFGWAFSVFPQGTTSSSMPLAAIQSNIGDIPHVFTISTARYLKLSTRAGGF